MSPDFPELLITGKEREYFTYLIKHRNSKSSGNHTGCAGRVYSATLAKWIALHV